MADCKCEARRYKLNIHEHTQKMDNETATKLKGTTKTFKEIKLFN